MSRAIIIILLAAHMAEAQPVALKIASPKTSITMGQTPTFNVVVTNISDKPARVIDAKRGDGLQRWYFVPVVMRGGKEVWLPQGCDLPAPPNDDSYVVVPPHATYSFRLSAFSGSWDQLKPGVYSVRIRYRHWRYGEEPYTSESNTVALRVVAK